MTLGTTQSGLIMQTRLEQLLSTLALEKDECILWPFGCSKAGYPMVWNGTKMIYGHSEICRHHRGERPCGTEAAHACGRRNCINKRHLDWKTPKANCADKLRHGTNCHPNRSQKGEKNPAAKISPIDVEAIRASTTPSETLAPLYGLSGSHIRRIRRGEAWHT
jgi:hypothetical protein